MSNNLQNAIKDKFQFRIVNGVPVRDKNGVITNYANAIEGGATVAIASGNLPVAGVKLEDENPVLHYHNGVSILAAGYTVNAIVDDMTDAEAAQGGMFDLVGKSSGLVSVVPVNSDLPIRHVKEYLRLNPRYVKSMTIISTDEAMYDGSMSLATLNPFHRENTREVELTKYFSVNQYRNSKIVIDFTDGELQWNDNLLWTLNGVPAGATVTVFIEFYD